MRVTWMEKAGQRTLLVGWRDFLDTLINEEELKAVVSKGACNKALGRDGICQEFFKVNWDSIKDEMQALFNQLYLDGRIMEQQKQGIMLCLPKTAVPTTPVDYRPITLLNTDYKILAPFIANQLRPTLSDMLHPSQHCGVPGNMIFNAVATVRDAIAYVELTDAPLCILSLDFTAAFDRISHIYLLWMLKSNGYSMKFITLIQAIYDKAFSSVQINGYVAGPFSIQSSVRQGYPVSMLLFALVLNPLICLLERHLTGIRIGHCTTKIMVVAYAYDITIFVTTPEDSQVNGDLLLTYEGERVLIWTSENQKPWQQAPGIHRWTWCAAHSRNVIWLRATRKVKTLVRDAYSQNLCLKRQTSMCTFVLSKYRFSRPQRSMSDNSQQQYPGIYGVVRSSECLYQPFNARHLTEVWT